MKNIKKLFIGIILLILAAAIVCIFVSINKGEEISEETKRRLSFSNSGDNTQSEDTSENGREIKRTDIVEHDSNPMGETKPSYEPPASSSPSPSVSGSGSIVSDNDDPQVIGGSGKSSGFACEQSSSWNFSSPEACSANAYVRNNENNSSPIYFEVRLPDGTLIYKSSVLSVGEEDRGFKLDKILKPGDYTASIIYHILGNTDPGELKETCVTVNIHIC